MKHSYLLAGIKAGRFITMIARNKGFSPRYILRVLFLLNAGLWSTLFSIVERRKYQSQVSNQRNLEAPIFILGNWHTGTTLLHQLLSLDKQFITPTVFQVSNPDHFLVSKKYYSPLMTKVLGSTRPMDNVKIGIDEPQEDEYALLKVCSNTPLENLIFNKGDKFFLDSYKDFMPDNENEFSDSFRLLSKKLTLASNRKVLFKNPFHSLRIPLLNKIFPNSKYIHIYRDPNAVIPSCVHMWNIVGSQNTLKGKWVSPTVKSIANLYKKIILAVRSEFKKLNESQVIEIKFENLELDAIKCIKNIYTKLDLDYTEEYNTKLVSYCNKLKTYKKNDYNTTDADKQQIKNILGEVLPEYF